MVGASISWSHAADEWEKVMSHQVADPLGILFGPALRLLFVPLKGKCLKGIAGLVSDLFGLAMDGRIDTCFDLGLDLITGKPRILQADFRIDAKTQCLAVAIKTVVDAPPLTASYCHDAVKATAVTKSVRLIAWLCVFEGAIGKGLAHLAVIL